MNDGVNRRRRVVGGEGARDAREGGADARERMLARSIEHVRRDGDDNHIARVRREVARHADEDDDGRDEAFRRDGEDFLEPRIDVAGAVRDADAKRRHDDHAERRESRVVRHHLREQRDERGGVQHIIDRNRFVRRGMDVVEMYLR